MAQPTIELVRRPAPDEFCVVDDAASEECDCPDEIKANFKQWNDKLCNSCAARGVLNSVAALSEVL